MIVSPTNLAILALAVTSILTYVFMFLAGPKVVVNLTLTVVRGPTDLDNETPEPKRFGFGPGPAQIHDRPATDLDRGDDD